MIKPLLYPTFLIILLINPNISGQSTDSAIDPAQEECTIGVAIGNATSDGRPFGYIYTNLSMCRRSSVSATVIHGVLYAEPAGYSTMWVILDQPATFVASPFWLVGATSNEADRLISSALCDQSNEIRACLQR